MKTLPRLIIALVLAFLGTLNTALASATPVIDYTSSPFNWVKMLSYYGPDFTTFKETPTTWTSSIGYGPILISNDKTNVNTVTMWFRMTASSSEPYTCPDLVNHGYTIPYQFYDKFDLVTLVKMSASSTPYSDVYTTMGMDEYGNSPVAQSSFIDIYNFGTNWTQNVNGSCSTPLNSDNSTSTISSGWYFLYFPNTSIYGHTLTNYNDNVAIDNGDPYQVSVLGDNRYDTSLMVEKMGSNFYFTSNHWAEWFPFKPSFPTIDFSFIAPPVVTEVTSCNPFTSDITSFFINKDFNFSTCLGDSLSWLITPSKGSLKQFTDLQAKIQNKPPFGYFAIIENGLNSLSATSSTATTTIDDITIPSFLDDMIFTPLKNGLAILLWFILLVFLFNRLKHIQL